MNRIFGLLLYAKLVMRRSCWLGPFPEVGAEDGASFGPGDQGEDDLAGFGVGSGTYVVQEVAHQFLATAQAVASLRDAVRKHHADFLEGFAARGGFGGGGFVDLVAELRGEVAETEDGEDGFDPALEGVDPASSAGQALAGEVADGVHAYSSSGSVVFRFRRSD